MAVKHTKRTEDYSKWYNEIVQRADLAEHSDVRGCMVIKPYGFAIWEDVIYRFTTRSRNESERVDTMVTHTRSLKRTQFLLERVVTEILWGHNFAPDRLVSIMKATGPVKNDWQKQQS